ncbi:MAG: hypothetical protein E6J29_00680 [Chloroflexi bacterium]|nr:MAG: hypothetical protein E6J29_00680 [Chloroflexota bacterium]TMD52436.1 MAG: hypothetical protein E6I85_10645 [Chloroflexota bacterium]
MATQTAWSADGQWFWDGTKWNDAVSADGRFRYNGTAWEPFSGPRSPMPTLAFGAPAGPPPPIPPPAPGPPVPPAPPAAAAGEEEYPSWLAPEEVARLKAEKATQQAAMAQAASRPPLPPQAPIDWGRQREAAFGPMQYAQAPSTSWWRAGSGSIFVFLAAFCCCGPLSLIYVWGFSAWRPESKRTVTFVVIGLFVLGVVLRIVTASLNVGTSSGP